MKSSVDSIVREGNRIFAYGWAFDARFSISKLQLEVLRVDGEKVAIPVNFGKLREDVEQAFPGERNARNSGWMTYAAWEGPEAKSIHLTCLLENGTAISIVLHSPVEAVPTTALQPKTVGRRIAARFRGWLHREPETVEPLYTAPDGADEIFSAVDHIHSKLLTANQNHCTLIIDHAMGGGANLSGSNGLLRGLRRDQSQLS